jgi:hypothetical protein
MVPFLIYSSMVILFILGAVHLYWALGGKRVFQHSLPRKSTGELLFLPRKIDCLIVGLGLIGFGFLLLNQVGLINLPGSNAVINGGSLFVGVIFLARALGDFKYLGFFKSIRNSPFAKYDSLYYSPLCLYIGFTFILSI